MVVVRNVSSTHILSYYRHAVFGMGKYSSAVYKHSMLQVQCLWTSQLNSSTYLNTYSKTDLHALIASGKSQETKEDPSFKLKNIKRCGKVMQSFLHKTYHNMKDHQLICAETSDSNIKSCDCSHPTTISAPDNSHLLSLEKTFYPPKKNSKKLSKRKTKPTSAVHHDDGSASNGLSGKELFLHKMRTKYQDPTDLKASALAQRYPHPCQLYSEVLSPLVEACGLPLPEPSATSHLRGLYWRVRLPVPWSQVVIATHHDKQVAVERAYLLACLHLESLALIWQDSDKRWRLTTCDMIVSILDTLAKYVESSFIDSKGRGFKIVLCQEKTKETDLYQQVIPISNKSDISYTRLTSEAAVNKQSQISIKESTYFERCADKEFMDSPGTKPFLNYVNFSISDPGVYKDSTNVSSEKLYDHCKATYSEKSDSSRDNTTLYTSNILNQNSPRSSIFHSLNSSAGCLVSDSEKFTPDFDTHIDSSKHSTEAGNKLLASTFTKRSVSTNISTHLINPASNFTEPSIESSINTLASTTRCVWKCVIHVGWPFPFSVSALGLSLPSAQRLGYMKVASRLKSLGVLAPTNTAVSPQVLSRLMRYDVVLHWEEALRAAWDSHLVREFKADAEIFCDASLHGFGAYLVRKDFEKVSWLTTSWVGHDPCFRTLVFPPQHGFESCLAELYATVTAVFSWKRKLRGRRLVCFSDNMTTVALINTHLGVEPSPSAPSTPCLSPVDLLLYSLQECCTAYSISLRAAWLSRDSNSLADLLSRKDAGVKFRSSLSSAAPHQTRPTRLSLGWARYNYSDTQESSGVKVSQRNDNNR